MLGLYGTAIGAGVLFLPINAGVGGLIPLIIMAILAFPMTFFAHRGLTRFVLSGKIREDITEVVEEHFGIGAGKLITLLYFFAIYPILLVYSVAITNTVDSFITHQRSGVSAARHFVADSDCRHDGDCPFWRKNDC
jgi:serine transporter